jgi:hypothetical protein
MKAVQPKAVILYAKLGAIYYPVACAKDVQITTTSDLIELAPRSSKVWKEYEYGRISGEIAGTGITIIDAGVTHYSIFDIIGTQFNQVKWLAKFSMNDADNKYKVFECNVLVKEINITGGAAALSNYSYTLQISGDVIISSTYVANTNPKIKTFEFEAPTLTSSIAIGSTGSYTTILAVYINGLSKKINIYPDGYGIDEVQWRQSNGTLYFGTPIGIEGKLKVIYIDL